MIQEVDTPIIIYENADQLVEVRLDERQETVLVSQRQITEIFDTSTDNVGLHLKHIYTDGELGPVATIEDYSVVRQEGERQVNRRVKHYNLDAVISVGYRVNSRRVLYFVVKNHPFSDGNKRSAAFLFMDFLHRNKRLFDAAGKAVVNDVDLAVLMLLVAESAPENKAIMIRLIMTMLAFGAENSSSAVRAGKPLGSGRSHSLRKACRWDALALIHLYEIFVLR